jgi:hypothetical protein
LNGVAIRPAVRYSSSNSEATRPSRRPHRATVYNNAAVAEVSGPGTHTHDVTHPTNHNTKPDPITKAVPMSATGART